MLSNTNSLYDPLGFVLSMVVQARTLYTDARRINFGWPESLPISFEKRWKDRLHSLKFLKNIKIDRCLRERE